MVWKKTFYDFYSFKYVKVGFMAQNVAYLDKCSFHVSLGRVYVLLLLDEIVYRCQLYSADWWFHWVRLCPYWCSVCWICLFLIEGLLMCPTIMLDLSNSHSSNGFCFAYSDALFRHIHIKGGHFFFENPPLYHHVIWLFTYFNIYIYLEACLVWN